MQEQNLQLQEIPNQKRIIEIRRLPGQLKVVASWWLIWNTIHQIVLDIFVAVVLPIFILPLKIAKILSSLKRHQSHLNIKFVTQDIAVTNFVIIFD